MGREPPAERARAALEQHVRDFLRLHRRDPRAVARDLLQRAGQALRLARELHGGRVGERFALPRDGGLDEPGAEEADRADQREREADRERRRDAAAVASAARVARAAQQPPPRERQHEDAEAEPDQLLIEPHVAVQYVAELVRDDALELRAIEPLERAARDGDRRVRGDSGRPRTR